MRVFITGVSGYLGGLVCRVLDQDPMVKEVVGVDLQPPEKGVSKLAFYRFDVRDPGLRGVMEGCDVCLHMAFILNEIKDKDKTYDINVNGSRNVFNCCLSAGVPWIIQLSSMAVFGPHPDNPVPLTEDDFPRGHPGCYYCYAKAEIEHYLDWLKRQHPHLDLTVLRPAVVIEERIDNTVRWMFENRFALRIRGHDSLAQYIHEGDLTRAIQLVLQKRATGIFHITSDDYLRVSEMLERMGIFAPALPKKLVEKIADLAFRFGASPISSHWVRMFSESMVGTSERIKELGWRPSHTSSELFDEYIVRRLKRA